VDQVANAPTAVNALPDVHHATRNVALAAAVNCSSPARSRCQFGIPNYLAMSTLI